MALLEALRTRAAARGRVGQVICGTLGTVEIESLPPRECAALGLRDEGRALFFAACRELQTAGEQLRREGKLFTPEEITQYLTAQEALTAAKAVLALSGLAESAADGSGEDAAEDSGTVDSETPSFFETKETAPAQAEKAPPPTDGEEGARRGGIDSPQTAASIPVPAVEEAASAAGMDAAVPAWADAPLARRDAEVTPEPDAAFFPGLRAPAPEEGCGRMFPTAPADTGGEEADAPEAGWSSGDEGEQAAFFNAPAPPPVRWDAPVTAALSDALEPLELENVPAAEGQAPAPFPAGASWEIEALMEQMEQRLLEGLLQAAAVG